MNSWSIRAKLALVLSMAAVLFCGGVVGVFKVLEAQNNDAAVVNLAGRQRMLSQKMTKEALGVAKDAEDQEAYRKALSGTAGLFDKTLSALLDGGETVGGGGDPVTLPPTTEEQIRAQLAEVQTIWSPFHEAVRAVASGDPGTPQFGEALALIEAKSIPLLKTMNKAVGMYEQVSRGKLATVKTLMLALLGAAVLAFAGIFFFLHRAVLKPLGELTQVASGVAVGDASLEVRHHSGDELGVLADSFRGVLDYFRTVSSGLEALSHGRLDTEVASRSEEDVLASSYEELRGTVSTLIEDLRGLSASAIRGEVGARSDASRFEGGFREIITGVNELLDALVGHLDSVPAPAVLLDRKSRVLYANSAATRFVGSESETMTGKSWSEFLSLIEGENHCPVNRAIADGNSHSIETAVRAGGHDHDIDYSGVPVTDDGGKVVGALAVIADLTEVKRAAKLGEKRSRYQTAEVERLTDSLNHLAAGKLDLDYSVSDGDADTAEIRENFMAIDEAVTGCIDTLRRLIGDVGNLAGNAVQGRFNERADAASYQGDYSRIVSMLNDTLDAFANPLGAALGTLERVAARNLGARMTGHYAGDFTKLQQSLNSAVGNLESGMRQVSDASSHLTFAAQQIGTGSQELANSNSTQASSLQEISATVNEITSQSRDSASLAGEVQTVTEQAQNVARKGLGNMGELTSAMEKIQRSAGEISSIVSTIDEIAFQTNLLALNAAVEAASAGDAGKGFAVVAEEVRNLAIRSAEAAKDTAGMIDDAVRNAENGIRLNEAVLSDLQEIHQQVDQVGDEMAKITELSQSQEEGTRQVNLALEQINQVTQQNAANSEESASSSQEMASQAGQLRKLVESFELGANDHGVMDSKPVDSQSLSDELASMMSD